MKRVLVLLSGLVLLATAARAEEAPGGEETVPRTVEGGKNQIKSGGKEIGEGFRGIGQGVSKTFKGEAAAEDYKEGGKQIGEGFRDLGTGTAGVGRGVGREIKKGVKGHGTSNDSDDE